MLRHDIDRDNSNAYFIRIDLLTCSSYILTYLLHGLLLRYVLVGILGFTVILVY